MQKAGDGGMQPIQKYREKSFKRSQVLPEFNANAGEQLEIQIDSGEVRNFRKKSTTLHPPF